MAKDSEDLARLLAEVERLAPSPENGLREEVFLLVSRLTPLINVDLWIQDERRRTLLTWRDDRFYGAGWHVPGGVIRYKESAATRIKAVARQELGTEVTFDEVPIAVQELIQPDSRERAHHISLLYLCRLRGPLDEKLRFVSTAPEAGQWEWHSHCPGNLIAAQQTYAHLFV